MSAKVTSSNEQQQDNTSKTLNRVRECYEENHKRLKNIEIAEVLGIHEKSVSRKIKEGSKFKPEELEKLAALWKVRYEYLLGNDDFKTEYDFFIAASSGSDPTDFREYEEYSTGVLRSWGIKCKPLYYKEITLADINLINDLTPYTPQTIKDIRKWRGRFARRDKNSPFVVYYNQYMKGCTILYEMVHFNRHTQRNETKYISIYEYCKIVKRIYDVTKPIIEIMWDTPREEHFPPDNRIIVNDNLDIIFPK